MRRFAPLLAFTFGILIASQCLGQCSSGRGHRTIGTYYQRAVPAVYVPAYQQHSVGLATPARQVLVHQSLKQKKLKVAKKNEIHARRANQIKTVENGSLLTVSVATGKWKSGMGILSVDGTTMLLEPKRWNREYVQIELPRLLLDRATTARLFIAANPETLLEKMEFQITP